MPKILLVEDVSIEAMDIKRTLESFGYYVPYTASTGEDAVEKAIEIMPDLILMDIVLKGDIDGIEVVSKIKKLNIPVIYLTAHSEESTIEKAKLTEPYGYIVKPYDPNELKLAIELALYKNKMEKDLKLSEAKYHSIFENSMDAILLTIPTGDILLDANPAAEKLFGYSREELCKLGRQGLVDADEDRLSELLRERELTGKVKGELNFKKKDGSKFIAEVSSAKFKDKDGNERTSMVIRDITLQKKAEEALKESEMKFRSFVDNAADILLVHDFNGKIVDVNKRASESLGYSNKELLQMNIMDIEQDTTVEKAQEEVWPKIKLDEPFSLLGHLRRKDGTVFPVEVRFAAVDIQGQRLFMGLGRDITEHLKMQNTLKESELKYRSLFEEDPNYTILLGKDGIIRDINNAAINLTGLSKKELIGSKFSKLEMIPPEDMAVHLSKINSLLNGECFEPFESQFLGKNGEIHSILVHFTPVIRDENVSYILVIASDITKQKKAENDLRASQIQLVNAMELSNLVNWEYDVESDLFTFDDRFYALYGTTAQREGGHLMSSAVYAREFVHPDDLHMVADEIEKAMKTSDPDYFSQVEHRILRRDGSIRYLMVRIAITKDAEGRTIKAHGTNQDITGLKEKEMKIRESLEEKEVLLREIHHRVKNNMQIISSLLNLQIQSEDSDETINVLKEGQGRVKSMAMIHEELYQSDSFTNINFKDYIKRLISNIFSSYRVKTGSIEYKLDIANVNINIDTAIPLGLIINELVTNSVKHAFPNSEGIINIELKQSGKKLELLVVDNGIGIPKRIHPKNPETLGLQLVNNLVKQIDGELEVEISHGTKFKITFKELEYKNRI